MSIQSLINLSNSMTINKRKMVGLQFTRNQAPRTDLTPTKQPFRFTIEVPGQPWYLMRSILERIDFLDRWQTEIITFANNARMNFIFRYQGDATFITNPTVVSFVGNQLTLTNLPAVPVGQRIFVSGDMLQIAGSPHPFMVVNDVVSTGAANITLTTHRPNIITLGVAGNAVIVGSSCQFRVFMPELPTYTLTPGAYRLATNNTDVLNNAIVTFDGPIVLYEYVATS